MWSMKTTTAEKLFRVFDVLVHEVTLRFGDNGLRVRELEPTKGSRALAGGRRAALLREPKATFDNRRPLYNKQGAWRTQKQFLVCNTVTS